jgi:hypothetical protein
MAMMSPLEIPSLGISDEEAEIQFEKLQAKLIPLWESISGLDPKEQVEQTVVVVPSQSIEFDCKGAEMQSYEERMLFSLMLLRQPRTRMIYVTSQTILPTTLDYYLSLMPGVITRHALERFINVSPEDRSPRGLTTKLLERPHLCEKIRSLIPDPDRAHLITYTVTLKERDLALRLGIPLYGSDPSLFYLGGKSGSREVFAKAGASYPIGFENLRSMDAVREKLAQMQRQKASIKKAMVKLNDGISGEGNAVIDLAGLPDPDDPSHSSTMEDRIQSMVYEAPSVNFDKFSRGLEQMGGIVEERIQGRDFLSPSVQMRVSPLGDVEILSTHDQLLGGPSGGSFLGSKFPADPGYGPLIASEAEKIGERLADLGALGRFAVDFVVVRGDDDQWESYAIEINLRLGGTTHPFQILQFLTEGRFYPEDGVFRAPSGQEKYYVASDHLESSLYRAFSPNDLFDIVIRNGLHFDQATQTGVLLHMLPTVGENGRFGVVAVGNSSEEADQLYERIQTVIQEEAKRVTTPPPLPKP